MLKNLGGSTKGLIDAQITQYEKDYDRYISQAITAADVRYDYFKAHDHYKQAYYFASELKSREKIQDAKTGIDASFARLNSYQQFIEACHDFVRTKNTHTEYFPSYLSAAIDTYYREETPTYSITRFSLSTLPALKKQLFAEINNGEMSTQKQEALWFALIPNTPLNAIFSMAKWNSTSLNSGTLNEVIKALTAAPLNEQANPYFPPRVINALNNLTPEVRTSFMEQLRQSASTLYEAAPIELKVHTTAPTSRIDEVNSRQVVNASTSGATLAPGKVNIPTRETDYIPL